MGHVGPFPWGKPHFFYSLGIVEILGFSESSICTKVVLLKTYHNILNYSSTANIEEVMKFYSLGNKSFETNFNRQLYIMNKSLRLNASGNFA